mmetsp:Transcript_60946/g.167109  ORF Transcript_60946/g.167109 Transcript_60946/m.167109 type:complete len:291 (+) Transcript_60946:1023-1895(+)
MPPTPPTPPPLAMGAPPWLLLLGAVALAIDASDAFDDACGSSCPPEPERSRLAGVPTRPDSVDANGSLRAAVSIMNCTIVCCSRQWPATVTSPPIRSCASSSSCESIDGPPPLAPARPSARSLDPLGDGGWSCRRAPSELVRAALPALKCGRLAARGGMGAVAVKRDCCAAVAALRCCACICRCCCCISCGDTHIAPPIPTIGCGCGTRAAWPRAAVPCGPRAGCCCCCCCCIAPSPATAVGGGGCMPGCGAPGCWRCVRSGSCCCCCCGGGAGERCAAPGDACLATVSG